MITPLLAVASARRRPIHLRTPLGRGHQQPAPLQHGFDTIMPKILATTVDRLLHDAHIVLTEGTASMTRQSPVVLGAMATHTRGGLRPRAPRTITKQPTGTAGGPSVSHLFMPGRLALDDHMLNDICECFGQLVVALSWEQGIPPELRELFTPKCGLRANLSVH